MPRHFRKRVLRGESVAQRKLRRAVRNAKDVTDAAADVDIEVERIRKEAADAIEALEVKAKSTPDLIGPAHGRSRC